jgi:hypothetical protein
MATLQIAVVKQGGVKTDVTLSTSADSATLATALSTNAVMVVFNPSLAPNEVDLDKAIELIEQKIAESSTWPPA